MLLSLHSYYSLRYGTYSLEELIDGLVRNNYETAVLTDINNSSAVLDFIRLGKAAGLNPLAGIEFRNGDAFLYTGIAKNNEGFRELNEWLSHHNRLKKDFPTDAPNFKNVFVIYPYRSRQTAQLNENEFIGIRPNELNQIRLEENFNRNRFVIFSPVSFSKSNYQLHTRLRAIDHNVLISQLKEKQKADIRERFAPKSRLLEVYKDFPELTVNTQKILSECSFDFDFKTVKNKQTFTGNYKDDRKLLKTHTIEGLERRYGHNNSIALERVQNELKIIDELNFSSYFLITDDICRYARKMDFEYVGRGSGANSVVAYCLGITNVCPIELNLYFERFLNPKRKTPPDFDIDFSWDERDKIYDYIFNRYGSGHTALMGAMSTFRSKSIIRELGKIYGLPKSEIDHLIQYPNHQFNNNEVSQLIMRVYSQLSDFPNQRTIHSSGVLISELPLTYYSALDYPPKGLPTVQFDMYTAEEVGFEKFDILSQRGIGHIKNCREIIKSNTGQTIDTGEPKKYFDDPKISEQLKSGNTIGCFYIESPAMRQLLKKLSCDNYLTLVAASSIIRPGVSSSGMMAAYIERHHHPEKVEYLHPVFEELLKETYGVMVYQEDVMKIGHRYGGLDLADADVLRRMMSGKYRGAHHLEEIRHKFFEHCKKMNYPEDVSNKIWHQMESFAGYSFNKAHSASFAVESYQSLFLKAYYPKEFMVAVLNNYGGFYSRKVYVNEARKAGAKINLPEINKSHYKTVIYGDDIFLGFDGILSLEIKTADRIVSERKVNGDYLNLENFINRTGCGLEQLILLIRCGAFRTFNPNKKELLWEAHLLMNDKSKVSDSPVLFEISSKKITFPVLENSLIEDLYDEIELMGFPVSGSIFDLAKSDYRGDTQSDNLINFKDKIIRMVGEFVTLKKVKTKNGKLMIFGTFFDKNGDFFDTIHFPPSLKKYPINGDGLYLIEGKVVVDFGFPSLEVIRCGKMSLKKDPRSE